ncbi:MAG TPA: PEP-CTERM sorting domain-containing protein [Rhizomicrobium sp.]|jgi:hypothetical protein
MELITRIRAAAFIGAMALAAPFAAHAGSIVETAVLTDDSGDYNVLPGDFARLFGTTFTLTQKTELTSVGFGYGRFAGGSVYAAIVPVDPTTGFPLANASDIEAAALGHAVINAPFVTDASQIGDATAALSLMLDPGTYAVVFGAGLYGTTGSAFSEGNSLGQDIFSSFAGSDWADFGGDDVRLLLNGDAVPEPMTLALMLAGLLGVAFVARGRSSGTALRTA